MGLKFSYRFTAQRRRITWNREYAQFGLGDSFAFHFNTFV